MFCFHTVKSSLPGMFAIRADHDFVVQEDFMKAVRKVADSKKLESKLDYKPV